MTLLDLPLPLSTCAFECARAVDVLEDIVLLNLVKPKEDSDAILEEHDLCRIVARWHRRPRLAHGRRGRMSEAGALHEHGRVHEEAALMRFALNLALLMLAHAPLDRRRACQATCDVPVMGGEPV